MVTQSLDHCKRCASSSADASQGSSDISEKAKIFTNIDDERLLHLAASAIRDMARDPLCIISQMISSLDGGSRGAILADRVEGHKERR
jgi:hypothetical protein